jgi:two-component system, NtrC family, response regulator AtoC
VLQQYAWPGNVRELRHAIEYCMTVSCSETITPADLPQSINAGGKVAHPQRLYTINLGDATEVDFRATNDQFERDLIMWALEKAKGNQALAAQFLKIPRTTLINKLNQL